MAVPDDELAQIEARLKALIERRKLLTELRAREKGYEPWYPWTDAQTRPPGKHRGWIFLAGRGTGKTDAGSNEIKEHVHGPPCIPGPKPHRIAIIAPTLGDARGACVQGETGILRHDLTATSSINSTFVRWQNGSEAELFGVYSSEDVERLRAGGNRCLAWLEEFAAWRNLDAAYTQMKFGLRSGPNPRWFATTTGKPRALLKQLLKDPNVVVTTAKTVDNPHLPQDIRDELVELYGGTRLGIQELEGGIVEDVEGAIWSIDDIEPYRETRGEEKVTAEVAQRMVEDMEQVVVAVDPPGGATECGIVVAGKKWVDGRYHFYVFADHSLKAPPEKWSRVTVDAYHLFLASAVVPEKNYGGDMVTTVVKQADPDVKVDEVVATRGKELRAEPIHNLYQQGRVHHMGVLDKLEEEMTTWVPKDGREPNPVIEEGFVPEITKSRWSPNRLDALVWALTYLSKTGEPRIWFA